MTGSLSQVEAPTPTAAGTGSSTPATTAPTPARGVETSRRLDLPLLAGVVLGTLVLSVFATWAILISPRDQELAALADSGRRSAAAVGRTEAAVGRIEQEVGRVQAKINMVTASYLRDAIASGKTYAAHLAAVADDLRAVPGSGPLIATLERHAATGIPDRRQLSDAFGRAVTDALAAESAGSDASWAARIAGRFGAYAQYASLQVGVDPGLSPSSEALRRIWDQFAAGDLAKIDPAGLSPAAAKAMEPWFAAVSSRQATLAAADRLVSAAAATSR